MAKATGEHQALLAAVRGLDNQYKRDQEAMRQGKSRYYNMDRSGVVNLTFSMIETMIGMLRAEPLNVVVEGLNDKGARYAACFERLLEHALTIIDGEMDEFLYNSLLMGTGILKVGFNIFGLEGGVGLKSGTIGAFDGLISLEGGAQDTIWVKSVNPLYFYVNPGARSFKTARFVVEKIYAPIEEVHKNPVYDEDARKRVEPARMEGSRDENNWTGFEAEALKRYGLACLREVYLKDDGGIRLVVFADGLNDYVLRDVRTGWAVFPYEAWVPIPDMGSFFGVPYPRAVREIEKGVQEIVSEALEKRRRFRMKALYSQPAFRGKAEAITNPSARWIEMRAMEGVNPIQFVEPTIISGDEMQLLGMLLREFHRVSGIGMMQMGLAAGATATETTIVQRTAESRAAPKNRRLHIALKNILRRILYIYYDQSDALAEVIDDILDDDELKASWREFARLPGNQASTVRTDIKLKMGMDLNVAAGMRRNQHIEAVRILSLPPVQAALAHQGKLAPVVQIVDQILKDLGIAGGLEDADDNAVLQIMQMAGGQVGAAPAPAGSPGMPEMPEAPAAQMGAPADMRTLRV